MKSMRTTRSLIALAAGMCLAGVVVAQSTTGGLSGTAKPGTTVVISNDSGFTRTLVADKNGQFGFSTLPIGDYTVEAKGIGTRTVTVTVGSSADESFENSLDKVTVVGVRTLIDTSTTDSRTVMTAKELSRLPIAQSAQGVALLAPGANAGAGGYFSEFTSFGGAGISENAYYVNGYFSGEPLSNLGQRELPYGAIAQQETYTGGYAAKYGRSAGGVINQVGKSGSNKWQFGGQFSVTPNALRSMQEDLYYPKLALPKTNVANPSNYVYTDPELPGTLYRRSSSQTSWNNKISAYVGGPILHDRLFAFLALEQSTKQELLAPPHGTTYSTHRTTKDPKAYLKLNWNISNDHLLEYTYLGERLDVSGKRFAFNSETGEEGAIQSTVPTPQKLNSSYNILSYTGYLAENLTLSATYGQSSYHNKEVNPSILPGVPLLTSPTNQNPAYNGGTPIPNIQGDYTAHDGRNSSKGLHLDLEYKLGTHTLSAGIDNIKFAATNEGTSQVADRFIFGRTTGNISAALGVGSAVTPTNPDGYYVRQYFYSNNTNMTLDQKAWYVEDRWNVTKNVLVSLGIRNDRFTSRNDANVVYMDAKNQWAPRLAASWDVLGDNSLKLFGNGGRYFLALPNNVAIRGASASILASQYYTYTGLTSAGVPTGLTPVQQTAAFGGGPSGLVSSNLELGQPVDVQSFAPSDLKNMYQDEFILGFEKALAKGWNAGAKLTHRALKSAVDDFCDPSSLATAAGLTWQGADNIAKRYVAVDANGKKYYMSSCYMFNPGGSNTYSFPAADGSGRLNKKISSTELGFTSGVKRKYLALDLFLERAFAAGWSMRIDYTYSKLRGNTEGQVKSEFGQQNISKTQDWDAAQIMQYADGALANDREHQLKVRGNYQFAKEWMITANASIKSGTPINCLGYFNPGNVDENSADGDPVGYGSAYHTCFGKIATQGSQRTPWTRQIDLGLQYRPDALQGKLNLTVNVFNLLNGKKVTQYNVTSEDTPYTVNNEYLMPLSRQAPRTVQFVMSYDY